MKISRVIIKNFRSFDDDWIDITLPLDLTDPLAFVGYNNSWKTNLIKAILNACWNKERGEKFTINDFHFLDDTKKPEVTVYFSEPIHIPTIYSADPTKDKLCYGAKLELKVDWFGNVSGYSHAIDETGKPITGQEQIKWRVLPILFNKYKDKLDLLYIDCHNLEKYLKTTSYSVLWKVLEDIKKDFNSPWNTIKDKKGNEIPRKEQFEKIFDYIQENILKTEKLDTMLKSIWDNIENQLSLEKDTVKMTFELPEANEIYDSISFKISDSKGKPAIPIDQLWSWYKSLLIIAILRALANVWSWNKIIIIEEPESYLHEHFQEYFYLILQKLSESNQIIYTTHSKKFINVFNPRTIIRLKNENYQKTTIIYKNNVSIWFPTEIEGFELNNVEDFPKYMRTLEPNIWNLIFSNKVIIVEGPHDLLAYKTILSQKINFGLNNIGIVCAWGKDTIKTLIELSNAFEVPCFVIHDWDLNDDIDPNTKEIPVDEGQKKLLSNDKCQRTKNQTIISVIWDQNRLHQNKRNLEWVLWIDKKAKWPVSVFEKINWKTLEQIQAEYPNFLPSKLLNFLWITIADETDKT